MESLNANVTLTINQMELHVFTVHHRPLGIQQVWFVIVLIQLSILMELNVFHVERTNFLILLLKNANVSLQ